MEPVCHRCGTTLGGSEPFCPHCGAPQLRYEAPDDAVPFASAAMPAAVQPGAHSPSGIRWREVILASAALAVPAGVLSALVGMEVLWVIAGAVLVLNIYRRRTGTQPDGRMSWRIGILFGAFAAVVASATEGLALLAQRYLMHQGAALTARYQDLGKQLVDQLARSNPSAASALPGFMHFWLTPDGVAAMVLLNTAGLVISMLIFAAAGGALGSRLLARTPHRLPR